METSNIGGPHCQGGEDEMSVWCVGWAAWSGGSVCVGGWQDTWWRWLDTRCGQLKRAVRVRVRWDAW